MSKPMLFPYTRPASDPPSQWQSLHHGHRTPLYALAWVCSAPEYIKLLPGQREWDITQVIKNQWFGKYNFTRSMCPTVYLGPDDNYYLIALFNRTTHPGFATRAQDPNDELIAAARDALFVPKDLEHTLQWYRFPMSWAKPDPENA